MFHCALCKTSATWLMTDCVLVYNVKTIKWFNILIFVITHSLKAGVLCTAPDWCKYQTETSLSVCPQMVLAWPTDDTVPIKKFVKDPLKFVPLLKIYNDGFDLANYHGTSGAHVNVCHMSHKVKRNIIDNIYAFIFYLLTTRSWFHTGLYSPKTDSCQNWLDRW